MSSNVRLKQHGFSTQITAEQELDLEDEFLMNGTTFHLRVSRANDKEYLYTLRKTYADFRFFKESNSESINFRMVNEFPLLKETKDTLKDQATVPNLLTSKATIMLDTWFTEYISGGPTPLSQHGLEALNGFFSMTLQQKHVHAHVKNTRADNAALLMRHDHDSISLKCGTVQMSIKGESKGESPAWREVFLVLSDDLNYFESQHHFQEDHPRAGFLSLDALWVYDPNPKPNPTVSSSNEYFEFIVRTPLMLVTFRVQSEEEVASWVGALNMLSER
jgi:hypothetical protein